MTSTKLANENRLGRAAIPSASEVQLLTCVDHIAKETMRMYHPLGINLREAKCDTSLPRGGGEDGLEPVDIRKGEHAGKW